MKFELIVNTKGYVGFYMPGGGQMLHDLMPVHIANEIIKNGKAEISDRVKGFSLCIDGKYYFEAKCEG